MLEGLISGSALSLFAVCSQGQFTSVNDLASMEISQAVQDAFSYFAQHLLSGSTAKLLDFSIDTVETATFAVLHRNGYGTA